VILIITNTQDLTSDFVVREILSRHQQFARLNTDEFPVFVRGLVSFGLKEAPQSIISWINRNKILDFDKVTSVLYRRPVPPIPDEKIDDPAIRNFCADECYDFLRGLWFTLECYWMSHPEAIRIAEHKVYQLKIAQTLPFAIPKTLITNDPSAVRSFYSDCNHRMIIKPLYLGFIKQAQTSKNIFTSVVSEEELKDIESISLCPSIFQEKIEKQFDIRVTVVGERVFAAKIIPTALPENVPDWRFAPLEKLRHYKYDLPADIESACVKLVRILGLNFGAIDLALDNKDNFVFFEINPNGQWAWLETALGFHISKAIVDQLSNHLI
jgi:glutathione synthase/RimK-type ligase-like ATP-grasp enzyme